MSQSSKSETKKKNLSHEQAAKDLGMDLQEYLKMQGLQSIKSSSRRRHMKEGNLDLIGVNSKQVSEQHKSVSLVSPQRPKFQDWRDQYKYVMKDHPRIETIQSMLDLLQSVNSVISGMGGFVDITSNGYWGQVYKQVKRQIQGKYQLPKEVINGEKLFYFARSYLFPFYFSKMARKSKGITTVYQSEYLPSIFIEKEQLQQGLKDLQKGLSFYDLDIIIFRNGQQVAKLNKDALNLDKMTEIYGEFYIDIRKQNPMDYGFIKERLLNSPFTMTISDYRQYQKIVDDKKKLSKFKYAQELKGGHIFFGVNFDPQGANYLAENLSALQNTFLGFSEKFDLLSYLEYDVPGCSFPQVYFKVKGCWTGGHSENLNMSAVNINHGPGSSEWYSLDFKHVEDFRSELKKYTNEQTKGKYTVDIINSEGLWYESLEWFIEHGYPVKRLVQNKGDIVISGPGTLHWVRSYGTALQSAWNIMVKTDYQAKAALHRHAINREVNFPRQNVIPLKTIFLKFLNHQHSTMKEDLLQTVRTALAKWVKQQQRFLQEIKENKEIKSIQMQKIDLIDYESFCIRCQNETLIYFLKQSPTKRTPIIKRPIACLECALKDKNIQRGALKIFYRYQIQQVHQLIDFSARNRKNKFTKEIQGLCNGIFVGHQHINCSVKQKRQNSLTNDQEMYRRAASYHYTEKTEKTGAQKWKGHWANSIKTGVPIKKQDSEEGQVSDQPAKVIAGKYDEEQNQAFIMSPMHSSVERSSDEIYIDGHKVRSRSRDKKKTVKRQDSQQKQSEPHFVQIKYGKKTKQQTIEIYNPKPQRQRVIEQTHNYYKGHIYSTIKYQKKQQAEQMNYDNDNVQNTEPKPQEQFNEKEYFKNYQIHDKEFNIQNDSLKSDENFGEIKYQDYTKEGKRKYRARPNNIRKSEHEKIQAQKEEARKKAQEQEALRRQSIRREEQEKNSYSRSNNWNSNNNEDRGNRSSRGRNNDGESRPKGCFNCKEQGHKSFECPNRNQNGHREQRKQRGPMKCYGCGQQGHSKRDCPQQGSNGGQRRGPMKCYGCGQEGHSKRDCPQGNNGGEKRGPMKCFSCGQEGHSKRDCPQGNNSGNGNGRNGGNYSGRSYQSQSHNNQASQKQSTMEEDIQY